MLGSLRALYDRSTLFLYNYTETEQNEYSYVLAIETIYNLLI